MNKEIDVIKERWNKLFEEHLGVPYDYENDEMALDTDEGVIIVFEFHDATEDIGSWYRITDSDGVKEYSCKYFEDLVYYAAIKDWDAVNAMKNNEEIIFKKLDLNDCY